MSDAAQKPRNLDELLADMGRRFPNQHTLSRGWASQVLTTVGDHISWGDNNSGYSPREIGWALVRVFGSNNTVAAGELIRGYMEAMAYYADGSIPADLQPQVADAG